MEILNESFNPDIVNKINNLNYDELNEYGLYIVSLMENSNRKINEIAQKKGKVIVNELLEAYLNLDKNIQRIIDNNKKYISKLNDNELITKFINVYHALVNDQSLKPTLLDDKKNIKNKIFTNLYILIDYVNEFKRRNLIKNVKFYLYILILFIITGISLSTLVGFGYSLIKKNKAVKIKQDVGKILNDHPQGKAYTLSANIITRK